MTSLRNEFHINVQTLLVNWQHTKIALNRPIDTYAMVRYFDMMIITKSYMIQINKVVHLLKEASPVFVYIQ